MRLRISASLLLACLGCAAASLSRKRAGAGRLRLWQCSARGPLGQCQGELRGPGGQRPLSWPRGEAENFSGELWRGDEREHAPFPAAWASEHVESVGASQQLRPIKPGARRRSARRRLVSEFGLLRQPLSHHLGAGAVVGREYPEKSGEVDSGLHHQRT